ncbi:uncharacterized protein LOC106654566 [Trichogramma pretiosum]|uniref:uncharacterized protein LOC106654566 n=1 Tax=Trichogramma pretiosum TaxID=7493 RepID=UPI0006C93F27|nr:uncharacterized protein LOC106654566 [Trichogramma pretiosum]
MYQLIVFGVLALTGLSHGVPVIDASIGSIGDISATTISDNIVTDALELTTDASSETSTDLPPRELALFSLSSGIDLQSSDDTTEVPEESTTLAATVAAEETTGDDNEVASSVNIDVTERINTQKSDVVSQQTVANADTKTSPIPIVSQTFDGPNPDGSYAYSYETGNNIKVAEVGSVVQTEARDGVRTGPVHVLNVKGNYSYISPEGTPISVSYVAGENGFQAVGAHIPTPPPIPPLILRALKWAEARREKERLEREKSAM